MSQEEGAHTPAPSMSPRQVESSTQGLPRSSALSPSVHATTRARKAGHPVQPSLHSALAKRAVAAHQVSEGHVSPRLPRKSTSNSPQLRLAYIRHHQRRGRHSRPLLRRKTQSKLVIFLLRRAGPRAATARIITPQRGLSLSFFSPLIPHYLPEPGIQRVLGNSFLQDKDFARARKYAVSGSLYPRQ